MVMLQMSRVGLGLGIWFIAVPIVLYAIMFDCN